MFLIGLYPQPVFDIVEQGAVAMMALLLADNRTQIEATAYNRDTIWLGVVGGGGCWVEGESAPEGSRWVN